MKRIVVLLFAVLLVASGCETLNKWTSKEETPPPTPKYEALNQAFYGFPDVPVPKELKYVNEKSFVYETPGLKVGVLFLTGNVELQSLENYFKINMARYGWKFVNSFKFRDISLNFAKEDKTCNIKMAKDGFSADVEIWVGPAEKGTVQKPNEPK
jgi:hypothetical protein